MSDLAVTEKKSRLSEITTGNAGVQFQTMADMWTLAQSISGAGMAPKGMNAQQVLVSIQMGAEIGIPPMTALRNIAIINGRPAIWGDLPLALAERSGRLLDFQESIEGQGEAAVATCTIVKKGRATPTVSTFSVADAKKAKLWGKAGPWTEYPKRMLALRARAFAIRDSFPEHLGGFYLREEVEDVATAVVSPVGSAGLLNKLKPAAEPFEDEPVDVEVTEAVDGEPSPEEIEAAHQRDLAEAGLFGDES